MEVGIVGLPGSGKTTIFNAVTRGKADVATYSRLDGKPNIGVAKVPDNRLDRLADVFKPRRVVPAEVSYVDLPAPLEGADSTQSIASELLNYLQSADALMVVARAFEDPAVSHVEGSIDPFRDVETVLFDLTIMDLAILERRLDRLEQGTKGAKAPERDAISKEQLLLDRLKAGLEDGTPLRDQGLSQDEAGLLVGYQFLTAKPLIIIINAAEGQTSETEALDDRLSSTIAGPNTGETVLYGKLEMELAQMDPAEEQEFRESLDVGGSGLDQMIGLSHEVCDVLTFFTGNQNEVRAWTVPRGITALKAAGKVHSDFERGFIRAEVVGFEDLDECGSIAEARKRGVLRQEGKGYVVADGDIMNVLFSI